MKTNKLKLVALLLVLFLCLGITTVRADDDDLDGAGEETPSAEDEVRLEDGTKVTVTVESESLNLDEDDGTDLDVTIEEGKVEEFVDDLKDDIDDDYKKDFEWYYDTAIDALNNYDDMVEMEIDGIKLDESDDVVITITSPSKEYAFATMITEDTYDYLVEDIYNAMGYIMDYFTAANINGAFTFKLPSGMVEAAMTSLKATILFKNATDTVDVPTEVWGINKDGDPEGMESLNTIITAPKNNILWSWATIDFDKYRQDYGNKYIKGYDNGAYFTVGLIMDSNKSTKVQVKVPVPDGYSNSTAKIMLRNDDDGDYTTEVKILDWIPGYAVFELPTEYIEHGYWGQYGMDELAGLLHLIDGIIYFQEGDNQQSREEKDDTPHTGDVSTIYAIILATISSAGIVIVNRKK